MTAEVVLGGRRFRASSHVHGVSGKNHDRVLVSPSLVGVGDGATPLESHWPSPAPLVVAGLAAMSAAAVSEPDVEQLWRQGIRGASVGHAPTGRPSAAVAVVRGLGADVELSMLGDCVGFLRLRGGARTERLSDPTVPRRDAAAARIEDAGERRAMLIENRRAMNRAYWIFADDERAATHTLVRRFRATDVELVLIASDGLESVLHDECDVVDMSSWISTVPTAEIEAKLGMLRSRSAAGDVPSACDDFSWVLLVAD